MQLLPASAPRFLGNTGHINVNILLIELILVLFTVDINANVGTSWIRSPTRYSRFIARHYNYPLATDIGKK